MARMMSAIRKVRPEQGLVIEDIPVPAIEPDEVLIQVEAASICGTDLHIWRWDEWSQHRIKPPLTIGHEFAGTIVEVGSKVEHARVGDYVSAESHVTCGMCYQCRTGQRHLCPKTRILGVDREGVFANYAAVPEQVIWLNDREKLPTEIASIQEPFGNAVFATLSKDVTGQSVAVFGCGPIGCFSVGIAKASGASVVYATDVNDFRLDLARQMGADAVFNPRELPGGDMVSTLIAANGNLGIDIIIEMSGAPPAITAAFQAVRNGGTVVLFGIPSNKVELDVAENMIFKNLTVLAVNGRKIFDTWYRTQWLLANKVVDVRPLISKRVRFDEIDDAMELLAAGKACKIVLTPEHREPVPVPALDRAAEEDPDITGKIKHP
ncbi:MAG: L-threonine 3-dehydrogenase [Phycisphaerales bacterium]|nr:MAG: L-threonine 3-dehydrogenase [Phycisphaerales bacterium]